MFTNNVYKSLLISVYFLHSFQGNGLNTQQFIDSHPCKIDNGGCSHLCSNSLEPPGYTCSCPVEFKKNDNKTCSGAYQELIFVTRFTMIDLVYVDSLENSPGTLPIPVESDALSVDYDPFEGFVYWLDDDKKKITRARLNGSHLQDIVSKDLELPTVMSLDLIAKHIYWADAGKNTIEVMHLTGGYRRVIVDKLVNPREMEVVPELGLLFWCDWMDNKTIIERSNLDGSERIVIVNSNLNSGIFITVDIKKLKIYWLITKTRTIEYSNLDGTNRTKLNGECINFTNGLKLMGDYLYWNNWFENRLYRIHKETGLDCKMVYLHDRGLSGTRVRAIDLRTAGRSWNPCKDNNGNCTQLCFYRHDKKKVCSCQNDYNLAYDKRTCLAPGVSLGCLLPNHPSGGHWVIPLNKDEDLKPDEAVGEGTIVKFACSSGYILDEEISDIKCLDSGWNKDPPRCIKLCPTIHSDENTEMSCFNRYNQEIKCSEVTDGSFANFECAPYYESTDQRTRRYCVNGTWNLWPPQCVPVCGEKRVSAALFAVNGTTVKRGDYPWTSALYEKDEETEEFVFICGGTMLAQKIILTAAHCITNIYGDTQSPEYYNVAVGKYFREYGDTRDREVQYSDLQLILVHPKYRSDSRRYASDIAVLVTKNKFNFSAVVQPACYRNLDSINLIPNDMGVIAGWGYTSAAGNISETLQEITVPYKDDATCIGELTPDWADKYLTYDKFCAGYHNKSRAVCEGDSGSGLVFQHRKRYYVLGIVSLSKTANDSCDVEVSGLYTKVAIHYDWLTAVISNYSLETNNVY